jgi:hypothetical protein
MLAERLLQEHPKLVPLHAQRQLLHAGIRQDNPNRLLSRDASVDGLRAAGVVALETRLAGGDRDNLTGLLDRRGFLTRVGEVLIQPGEYEMVVGDVDRLRRLNEALGHERTDLVLSAPFPISPASLRRKMWRDLSGQTFYKQRIQPLWQALRGRHPYRDNGFERAARAGEPGR